ncbi:MAG: hypothetical protein ABIH59_00165 [archaeon]
MNKQKRFNKILQDIKNINIQGARNIAKAALKAYFLFPSKKSKKEILSLRPTEPMMENVLDLAETQGKKEILKHFDEAQEKINKYVLRLIKKNEVIFTHCHSTNVVNSLIYAKKNKKIFQVYNTETRPLFQGRKTSKELSKAKIKVTEFVDSATRIALIKKQETKKVSKVFLGADALIKEGIINKVGSGMIAEIAYDNGIPVFIVADSWKFTKEKILLEQRSLNEIWDKAPKNIKIKNPAFEFVPKKYIKAIISELGVLRYSHFVKKFK